MKKFLMIIAALAVATGAFAQQQEQAGGEVKQTKEAGAGRMWLGSAVSFSASGAASINITPTFGYFVADNISVEGTLGLGFGSYHGHYGLAATGRYWLPIEDTPLVYTPGVRLGFDIDHYSNIDTTYTDFSFGVQLGSFHYIINPSLSVSGNICGFSLSNIGKANSTSFDLTTTTTLSLNYFF